MAPAAIDTAWKECHRFGYSRDMAIVLVARRLGRSQSARLDSHKRQVGTVTPPAHIYRPMCRGTSAAISCPHGILLCRFWEPTWQHFNLANNLTPIWFTSPPQPRDRVKGFHVQRIDNRCFNPPDAPISCYPWCWFRLSVYRLRSSVTRSQREECAAILPTTRLFVPQNWQPLDAESHWGPTQSGNSSGWSFALCERDFELSTKSLSRPCIPFELLFSRRVILSGTSLHLVWCYWVSGKSCAPLFAPLLGFCLTSCDV